MSNRDSLWNAVSSTSLVSKKSLIKKTQERVRSFGPDSFSIHDETLYLQEAIYYA